MSEPAPWEGEAVFPLKPEGPPYGFVAGGRLYACSPEDLIRRFGDTRSKGAALVWTPEAPRLVTPWEVPLLVPALRKRNRDMLARWAAFHGFATLIWGALAVAQFRTREFPMYASLAAMFGLGVFVMLRARRRLGAGAFNAARVARASRFFLWMRLRPRSTGLILAACLALAGFWQVLTGLDRSIYFAGLIKPLVFEGEAWRLATGGVIHGGALHFLVNVTALIPLAGLAEAFTSRSHVAVVFLVSMLAGSLATLFLSPFPISVGASGGILGILGFVSVFVWRRRDFLPPGFVKSIFFSVMSTAVLGAVAPTLIDNAAHAGGLLAGAALGGLVFSLRGVAIPVRPGPALRMLGALCVLVVAASSLSLPFVARYQGYYREQLEFGGEALLKGDTAKAIEAFTRAIENRPKHPSGYWERGRARHQAGDYAGAIEDTTRALELNPDLAEVYYNRSLARLALKDPKGAMEDVERALKLEPKDVPSLLFRARLHLDRGDPGAAKSDCDAALAIHAEHADALALRGEARMRVPDLEGALKDYEAALKTRPRHPGALLGRGLIRREKGDVTGARADFEAALKAAPADWPNRSLAEAVVGELKGK